MTHLIRVATVRRVPVLFHWSVFALCFFYLGVGFKHIIVTAASIAAYLLMLLIHEFGHHYVAVRRGYHVISIEVFPFHATCKHDHPLHAADSAMIAWGGPAAQIAIAVPIIVYLKIFGYTPFAPFNVFFAILGFMSFAVALFNLLPIAPLDGKLAWSLVPILLRRPRKPAKRGKTALEALEDAVTKAQRGNGPM